jgi:AraC-like DNA-binding protein
MTSDECELELAARDASSRPSGATGRNVTDEIPARLTPSGLGAASKEDLLALLAAASRSNSEMERRAKLLEHGLGCLARGDSGGVILFDWKGRLVKADPRAELTLTAVGVELNRTPRLRVGALDVSDPKHDADSALPDWLASEWIQPIVEDGERLGTAVLIPERVATGAGLPQGGLPGYKLRRVMEFIEAHIDQPMPLERLAAAAAVSPFHFHRQFKRSTGMTPHQYIVQMRTERAKALLSGSDLPLAEVAAQSGFADQSHFTSTFRKTTSMTPRSYRNATSTM